MPITCDGYSNGHGTAMVGGLMDAMVGVRVSMRGILRHGRNMILSYPYYWSLARAARRRLIAPKVYSCFGRLSRGPKGVHLLLMVWCEVVLVALCSIDCYDTPWDHMYISGF